MAFKHILEFIVIAGLLGGMPGSLSYSTGVQAQTANAVVSETRDVSKELPKVEDRFAWPKLKDLGSLGIDVTSKSAIVTDVKNGKILFAKNPNDVRPIASITKLMTALVVLESGVNLDDNIEIVASDYAAGTGYVFEIGQTIKVHDVLLGTLVLSGNDAARALARSTGMLEEDFVEQMNERAQSLGMVSTKFMDPSGIDPENVSTARELVTLVRTVSEREEIRDAAQTLSFGDKTGTNELLNSFLNKRPYEIVVGKTGSLPDTAGYCLVERINEADHGVIVVSLGSDNHFSRFSDVKALANWALTRWVWNE